MKLITRPEIQRQKKAHNGVFKDYEERNRRRKNMKGRKEKVEVRKEQRNVNKFEA